MKWNSLSNGAIIQEIGKRVKEIRLDKNLTQQELAKMSGISLFTVAQIERGKPVSLAMLIPVLRELRLIDNLELLLPQREISPVELLKAKGKVPKRAKRVGK
jgi:transcriptional regulator with XRE-family HTH domain